MRVIALTLERAADAVVLSASRVLRDDSRVQVANPGLGAIHAGDGRGVCMCTQR